MSNDNQTNTPRISNQIATVICLALFVVTTFYAIHLAQALPGTISSIKHELYLVSTQAFNLR